MSIKATITKVRPNKDVEFFKLTDAQLAHISDVYEKTGKMTTNRTISTDGLTQTVVRSFANNDDWVAFRADPIVAAGRNSMFGFNQASGHVAKYVIVQVG